MPKWKPEAKWKDRDVFVIGGGASLKTFDWNLLKSELTVGCNDAYQLGSSICKICLFGDSKWLKAHEKKLAEYSAKGGVVFTCAPQLRESHIPWLWVIGRRTKGLFKDALGWNGNTGASAVNLALLLGAKIVYLLGFDMTLSPIGEANWHDNGVDKPNAAVYPRFLRGFIDVSLDLRECFPGKQIINVTDDSKLEMFPKIGCKEFWMERTKV